MKKYNLVLMLVAIIISTNFKLYSQDTILKKSDKTIESESISIKENSIEETKAFILKEINEHGFEEDSFKTRYKASFEGDYLRLIEMTKKNKELNAGILFDFSNVYKFQKISIRSEELAYLNIFVTIIKKNDKKDKLKLIMRVDGPAHAKIILNALKQYNSLLIKKEKTI